jgi:O-antigen ligase
MLSYPNIFPLVVGPALGLLVALLVSLWGIKGTIIFVFVLLPVASLALLALPSAVAKLRAAASQLRIWHGFWFILFASGLVFRIRDTSTTVDNPLDIMAIYRFGLVSLVGLLLLSRLASGRADWSRSLFRGLVGLVAGYALVSLASTIWSAYPLWTLYKSVEYFVDVALVAAIVATFRTPSEFKSLFDVTWLILSALVGTVWLGAVVWPGDAFIPDIGLLGVQLKGVLPLIDSNSLSEICGILIVVCFTRFLFAAQHKQFYAMAVVLVLPALVLAQGRSGTTGMITGLMLVLLFAVRARFVVFASALLGALIYLTPAGDMFLEFFMREQDPKYFASLSGRTDIWAVAWELFLQRPITGFGGYAAARFSSPGLADRVSHMGAGGTSVLSTWFELLIGVGAPGFLLMAGAVAGAGVILSRMASRRPAKAELPYRLAIEALGVLGVITVRSVFTPNLIWHFPAVFLLVIAYAEALRRIGRNRMGTNRFKEMSYGYDRDQNRGRQVALARVPPPAAPTGVL